MIGYQALEQAVKGRVVTVFELNASLCQAGDVDALFQALQQTGAKLGFLLEYAGGERVHDAPFNGKSWLWHMNGYALVRFDGDSAKIEIDARQIVDTVINLFDGSHTLGNLAAVARVNEIDEPLPSTVNDVPFYWIPFLINVMEKI
jgi:hypothetical protein